ncbi:MAG: VOC family protein [Pseudomonadota bacterium]
MSIEFLHTMVRVTDIDASLRFYRDGLGLTEVARYDVEAGRFTLVFLASPDDVERAGGVPEGARPTSLNIPMIELTHNWDPEAYEGGRNFGHLAYQVDNIYAAVDHLFSMGVTISRPPRDGRMAFIRSPDGISIELLQKGAPLEPKEPWASAENIGSW